MRGPQASMHPGIGTNLLPERGKWPVDAGGENPGESGRFRDICGRAVATAAGSIPVPTSAWAFDLAN